MSNTPTKYKKKALLIAMSSILFTTSAHAEKPCFLFVDSFENVTGETPSDSAPMCNKNRAPTVTLSTPTAFKEGEAEAGNKVTQAIGKDEDGDELEYRLTNNDAGYYQIDKDTAWSV